MARPLDGVLLDATVNGRRPRVERQPESHYCEGCDPEIACEGVSVADAVDAVTRWHDDKHAGAFGFCDLEPCRAVGTAVEP